MIINFNVNCGFLTGDAMSRCPLIGDAINWCPLIGYSLNSVFPYLGMCACACVSVCVYVCLVLSVFQNFINPSMSKNSH